MTLWLHGASPAWPQVSILLYYHFKGQSNADKPLYLAVGQLKEQLKYLTGLTHALCEKGNIDPATVKPFKIPSPHPTPAPGNALSPATTLPDEMKALTVSGHAPSRSSDRAGPSSIKQGSSRDSDKSAGSRNSGGSSKSSPLLFQ